MVHTAEHPASRPIGWEFAERYPHVYRDPPLALRRTACLICGHPTGDCTEEDHFLMAKNTPKSEARPRTTSEGDGFHNINDDPEAVRAAYQGGRRTAEEATRLAVENAPPGPTYVVVKEDVYEEVEDPNATTKRSRLLFHKGQVITEDQATQFKVKAVQQQNRTPGETK